MNWYQKAQFFKESSISVPRHVFADIINYVQIQSIKFAKNKRIITPPKRFELDFTGTSFEFLNTINTTIIVKIGKTNRLQGEALFYPHGSQKEKGDPEIFVNINYDMQKVLSNLEHEIFHFIQFLIGVYKVAKLGLEMTQQNIAEQVGGLPSKKLLDKEIANYGQRYSPKGKEKAVPHPNIPVEQYPNLILIINSLQHMYSFVKNKISKKDFFIMVRNLSEAEMFDVLYKYNKNVSAFSTPLDTLYGNLRNLMYLETNPKLYKHMLNKIYTNFVNKEQNIDHTQSEILDEIRQTQWQKHKQTDKEEESS